MQSSFRWVAVGLLASVVGTAGARSIPGVSYVVADGATTVTVTLDAETDASVTNALYMAWDATDRGETLANWGHAQRVRRVSPEVTTCSFPLPEAAFAEGIPVCRIFLANAVAPYDHLVESVLSQGRYYDTGLCPTPTTIASMDIQLLTTTSQQRMFGISSDDASAGLSFDTYINGSGYWASALQNGKGDWLGTDTRASAERVTVTLDATTRKHTVTRNGLVIATKTHGSTPTATSTCPLYVLALNRPSGVERITSAHFHSFVLTNDNALVAHYVPCVQDGAAQIYDLATGTFVAPVNPDAGSLTLPEDVNISFGLEAGETAFASSASFSPTSSDPTTGSVWKGTVDGVWDTTTANWFVNGVAGQAWSAETETIFNDNAVRYDVTLNGTLTPSAVVVDAVRNYSITGDGALAGTGTFSKLGLGRLNLGTRNTFTGDVLISGGEVALVADNDVHEVKSGMLGNPRVARTVVVSNATLRAVSANGFAGGGRSQTPILADLKFSNSTLELTTNFAFNVGDVYFDNSDVNFHGGLSYFTDTKGINQLGAVGDLNSGSWWGAFYMNNVHFSGTRPVTWTFGDFTDEAGYKATAISWGRFAPKQQATVEVANLTGDSASDVTISLPIVWVNGNGKNGTDPNGIASGFRKTGAGTLELAHGGDPTWYTARNSTYTGDVDVVEGTLKISAGNANVSDTAPTALGAKRYPHTITVHAGATLEFTTSDVLGQGSYETCPLSIVVDGGTLKLSGGLANTFGPITFRDATISLGGGHAQSTWFWDEERTQKDVGHWATLYFPRGVRFEGTRAVTIPNVMQNNSDPNSYTKIAFGHLDGTPSDLYVADLTGNGDNDLILQARLEEMPPWRTHRNQVISGYNTVGGKKLTGFPFHMRKTGPGTLLIDSQANTTTGTFEIAEGTLHLSKRGNNQVAAAASPLGDLTVEGRVALRVTGGTLEYTASDTLGQASCVNSSTFVVSNGTIKSTGGWANSMPYLDLYNAKFDFSAGLSNYGAFIFTQRVRWDGTEPYDIPTKGSWGNFALGYANDFYAEPTSNPAVTNWHGKGEFYVADITKDAGVDVKLGVTLQKQFSWGNGPVYKTINFCTGLLKTGPGTLSLCGTASSGSYYVEATRVKDGTLLVDTTRFASTNIFVQAGAYVGGTGTVARLTFEPGGGLTAAPGQTKALTVTAAELPSDNVVAVDIPCTGTLEESVPLRVPLATAGAFTGAKWNVTVNGAAVPKGFSANVSVRDGVLVASLSKGGAMIVIR